MSAPQPTMTTSADPHRYTSLAKRLVGRRKWTGDDDNCRRTYKEGCETLRSIQAEIESGISVADSIIEWYSKLRDDSFYKEHYSPERKASATRTFVSSLAHRAELAQRQEDISEAVSILEQPADPSQSNVQPNDGSAPSPVSWGSPHTQPIETGDPNFPAYPTATSPTSGCFSEGALQTTIADFCRDIVTEFSKPPANPVRRDFTTQEVDSMFSDFCSQVSRELKKHLKQAVSPANSDPADSCARQAASQSDLWPASGTGYTCV